MSLRPTAVLAPLFVLCGTLAFGCATPDDPVGTPPDSGPIDTADTGGTPEGLTVLYIGHSFGRPFAEALPDFAEDAGVEGHVSHIVMRGGANGAPQALWDDDEAREEALDILATGEVDVMVMICCSESFVAEETLGTDPAIGLWMDEALEANPDTRFALAAPWPDYPERYSDNTPSYPDAESYAEVWEQYLSYWHLLIEDVRADYPGVAVTNLPHGRGAVELRTLYEADDLPEVVALTSWAQPSVFTDTKGHADQILLDLGTLVWLGVLYDLSPGQYPTPQGYETDLVGLAEQIVEEDPMVW